MNASYSQVEFNLRQRAAKAVNRDSIEELCGLLRGRGWVTARQLQILRPLWNERFIRLLARGSRSRIVSGPGMPGYALASETTDEDLQRAGRTLLSQGRDMSRSGIAYLRVLALRRKTQEVTAAPVISNQ